MIKPEGLAIPSFRPDSKPYFELSPLAAGNQTSFEKGVTAYVLEYEPLPNSTACLINSQTVERDLRAKL